MKTKQIYLMHFKHLKMKTNKQIEVKYIQVNGVAEKKRNKAFDLLFEQVLKYDKLDFLMTSDNKNL